MSVSVSGTIFRQAGTDASLLGFLTANIAAFTTVTVTGTSGNVTSITVGGVEVLGASVAYITSTAETARLIAAQINAFSTTHRAFRVGDAGSTLTIQTLTGGAGQNGQALVVTATLATTNTGAMAGGGATGATSAGAGTANAEGSYYNYLIGNNTIQVYGSLAIDPVFECCTFGASASGTVPRIDVRAGGVLTLGGRALFDGVFNYTEGVVIHDPVNASAFSEAQAIIRVAAGGTLDWFSGIVQGRACLGFMESAAAVRIYSKNAVIKALGLSTATSELLQVRQRATTTEIYGLTIENCDLVFIAQPVVTEGLQPSSAGKSITFSTASPNNVWFIFRDYDPSGGATVDVAFHSSKWASIDDCATGSAIDNVGHFAAANINNRGLIRFRQAVTLQVQNAAGTGINGRVFARDTNHGARLGSGVFGTHPSFVPDNTYESAITAGAASFTGESRIVTAYRYQNQAFASVLPTASITTDYRTVENNNSDRFRFALAAYGFEPATTTVVLKGVGGTNVPYTMLPDLGITQATQATVAAYTALDNLDRVYDFAQHWLQLSGANMELPGLGNKLIGYDGSAIDCGSRNVVIDATAPAVFAATASTITILASALAPGVNYNTLRTTGTISFINGAVPSASLIYQDSSGTSVPVTAPNLIAGSRVQIFNVTDNVEMANVVLAGAGYAGRFAWTADKVIRLRATYCVGTSAKRETEATAVLTSAGASFLAAQADDAVYNALAINGSTVTEFSADYPNIQIDVSDPDGVTTVPRLYAWWKNNLTTEGGIRDFFGGVVAEDEANFRIVNSVVSVRLDNVSAAPVIIGGGRLYNDSGATVIASGSGSIQMDPLKAYVASGANADIAAIKAKTDSLTFTVAGQADVNVRRINGAAVQGNGTAGDLWRGV
jgi:hypothetical protein